MAHGKTTMSCNVPSWQRKPSTSLPEQKCCQKVKKVPFAPLHSPGEATAGVLVECSAQQKRDMDMVETLREEAVKMVKQLEHFETRRG